MKEILKYSSTSPESVFNEISSASNICKNAAKDITKRVTHGLIATFKSFKLNNKAKNKVVDLEHLFPKRVISKIPNPNPNTKILNPQEEALNKKLLKELQKRLGKYFDINLIFFYLFLFLYFLSTLIAIGLIIGGINKLLEIFSQLEKLKGKYNELLESELFVSKLIEEILALLNEVYHILMTGPIGNDGKTQVRITDLIVKLIKMVSGLRAKHLNKNSPMVAKALRTIMPNLVEYTIKREELAKIEEEEREREKERIKKSLEDAKKKAKEKEKAQNIEKSQKMYQKYQKQKLKDKMDTKKKEMQKEGTKLLEKSKKKGIHLERKKLKTEFRTK